MSGAAGRVASRERRDKRYPQESTKDDGLRERKLETLRSVDARNEDALTHTTRLAAPGVGLSYNTGD